MANRNWASAGRIFSMHTMPVLIDCNFIVDSTNGNGLGIRSLKGPTISNVYMHTSATPAAGNPNPQAGVIVVQLADNYNRSLSGFSSIVSPLSGSNIAVSGSSLTANNAYIITVVGTSTAADWAALGVPIGVTPAPGVTFIAAATGAGSGSGQVQASLATGSTIGSIETLGDPNTTIAPLASANQGFGAQIILGAFSATNSSTTTKVLTAPANNSVISLAFYLSNSSTTVQGE